ncbi:MAG: hypothetical protein EOO36_24995 [Cytophagaceae bacterium]|nr:MAG: hypothetical protein EOO36_24995 [Cytophagaceae bacterium]
MPKFPLLCALLSLGCLPAKNGPWFSGCVVYENGYEYLGKKNEFYTFSNGKAVLLADTARHPDRATFEHLPTTTTILGYPCQTLHLVEGSVSTLVYYSAAVRVNAASFSRCTAPGWAALLQATGGALPLRTVSIDVQHDVTATAEAISVQAMPLAAAEFTVDAPAR